ncbi:MAG: hypothetical protein OEV59_09915 [Deltaproteobacteria bacterium]|nr:hypothetical protein [Deltaproteobacteria bacterium]
MAKPFALTMHTPAKYDATVHAPPFKDALIIFGVLCAGLIADNVFPVWGQVGAGAAAWGALIYYYLRRADRGAQILLSTCLVLAFLGEVFFSLVWHLYDYRFFNIPHYVPPGHVLVFLLGCAIAPHMPRYTTPLVVALSAPYVILGAILGFDELGIILFILFIACLLAGPDRRFYSTMFMLCMALEVAGTALGNWTWRPEVPLWSLENTNPPLAAGTLYCLLDFLTMRLGTAMVPFKSSLRSRLASAYDYAAGLVGAKAPDVDLNASD